MLDPDRHFYAEPNTDGENYAYLCGSGSETLLVGNVGTAAMML